jgi:Tol biopolymer transport system component
VVCRITSVALESTGGFWIVKPDGSGTRALTTGPGNSGFPSWSPDGKQVVYRFWE